MPPVGFDLSCLSVGTGSIQRSQERVGVQAGFLGHLLCCWAICYPGPCRGLDLMLQKTLLCGEIQSNFWELAGSWGGSCVGGWEPWLFQVPKN